MKFIFEGPDGSGKSTLINDLKEEFPEFQIIKSIGPLKVKEEAENVCLEIFKILDSRGPIFFDRCYILSELIYGPILRNISLVGLMELEKLTEKIKETKTHIIYCRADFSILEKLKLKTKKHKSQEQIDLVKKNLRSLVSVYDNLIFSLNTVYKIPVLYYNRNTMESGIVKNFIRKGI